MSDEILTSIISERSSHTAGKELGVLANHYNTLMPSPPKGEAIPSCYDISPHDETSQAKAGSTFTHRMPSSHWAVDTFAVVELNAPSAGTTCERPGLKVINQIIARNGDTVQEFKYVPVMSFILSKSSPSERQQILNAVGSASASGQTVLVPIPTFWNPLGQGGVKRNNVGLPMYLLNSPIELEIQLNPASSLLASGGAFAGDPYSSFRIIHVLRKSTASVYKSVRDSGEWNYWAYDYQTTSTATTLANGVETRVDLSQFDGSSAGVFMNPVASASVAVNDDYVLSAGVTRLRAELNGAEYMRLTNNISPTTSERVIDYLAYAYGVSNGTDAGDATFSHRGKLVPFGGSLSSGNNDDGADNQVNFESYYNLRDATKVDMYLTNDSGAELKTFFTNIRYAKYYIKDGQLFRRK